MLTIRGWTAPLWLTHLLCVVLGGGIAFLIVVASHALVPWLCEYDGVVWGTWSLVLVGAVSAVVAFGAYLAVQKDKRIDRTVALVHEWFEPVSSGPSPEDCQTFLADAKALAWITARMFPSADEYKHTKRCFIYEHNYFDKTLTMIRYKLIDRALFFEHQKVIIRESATTLNIYYDFYEQAAGFNQPRAAEELIPMLDEMRRTAEGNK